MNDPISANTAHVCKRTRLALRSGWRCRWCGVDVIKPTAMIDSIVYRRDGGGLGFSNQVLACESCRDLRSALRVVLGPKLFPMVKSPGGLRNLIYKIVAGNKVVDKEDPNQVHLFDDDGDEA